MMQTLDKIKPKSFTRLFSTPKLQLPSCVNTGNQVRNYILRNFYENHYRPQQTSDSVLHSEGIEWRFVSVVLGYLSHWYESLQI